MLVVSDEILHEVTAALNAASDLVYIWDLENDRITWIGDGAGFFGQANWFEIATGALFQARLNPDDLVTRQNALDHHYVQKTAYDVEYRLKRGEEQIWLHDRGAASFSAEDKPVRLQGVLRIISRRKAYEAELEARANFDDLTGHFNRKRLRDALSDTMIQSQRYGAPACYLSVGIDKFAMFNEAYGQEVSDAVIVGVGQRLAEVLRTSDLIGRVAADEYGVVLARCPTDHLPIVANKILRGFRERPMITPGGAFHVTVSLGGVALPAFELTAYDIMAKAEIALTNARQRGRDCFVAYEWSVDQQSQQRTAMEIGEMVMKALKTNRLQLAFQPVVNSSDGVVSFHEALLRLRTEEGQILSAFAFVPAVEQLGLIRNVDQRVLELAVGVLNDHADAKLAVNISGLTVSDRSWLRRLIGLLRGRRDVAARLIVEITESAAMSDMDEAVAFVRAVRGLGCKVAIDDFGAGYTSFKQLRALDLDIVKIDGAFVKNLEDNPDNKLFIRTLADLARGFNLETVAEFVENQAAADYLHQLGITYLQGYHYGKPQLERPWAPLPA